MTAITRSPSWLPAVTRSRPTSAGRQHCSACERPHAGLAEVQARIWELLREPISVSAISETIAREYEVSLERCEADVLRFLEELAEQELIEVRGGP